MSIVSFINSKTILRVLVAGLLYFGLVASQWASAGSSAQSYKSLNQIGAAFDQQIPNLQLLGEQSPPSRQTIDQQMENDKYPIHPNSDVTTGELCNRPSSRRYPEGIAYCERSVESSVKRQIIIDYDNKFSYDIQTMPRGDFKIDHLIPLCMGGANSVKNLWPQHKTVYVITDPLEQELCQKMADGKLLQKDAVDLILQAKHNLYQVEQIRAQVRAL